MNYKQLATYANSINWSLDTALKCLEISLVCSRNSVIILQSYINSYYCLYIKAPYREKLPLRWNAESILNYLSRRHASTIKTSIFRNSESGNVWL